MFPIRGLGKSMVGEEGASWDWKETREGAAGGIQSELIVINKYIKNIKFLKREKNTYA